MRELERTFLAKFIPEGLEKCKSKEIIDIYIPKNSTHPKIRIRKSGDHFEMTKKEPPDNDASQQNEQTIKLTEEEFQELVKLDGKKSHKVRYYYEHEGRTAEIAVFQDDLKGLILVDFEFENEEEKNSFKIPSFCLADVTQEEFAAGGMLCGKTYDDIKKDLDRFNYKKLFFDENSPEMAAERIKGDGGKL